MSRCPLKTRDVVRGRAFQNLGKAMVAKKPVAVGRGVWLVTLVPLEPALGIGRRMSEFYFHLTTDMAEHDGGDGIKIVEERSILIAPRPGQPLFRSWAVVQNRVYEPQVGNILSGTELRWYVTGADRGAEYLVTGVSLVRETISVCAHSSTPRDCRDDWCGIKHSQKSMVIEAGLDITARRIAGIPGSGRLKLLEGVVEIFRSRDRDCSDDCDRAPLHIGGTADGYVFTP